MVYKDVYKQVKLDFTNASLKKFHGWSLLLRGLWCASEPLILGDQVRIPFYTGHNNRVGVVSIYCGGWGKTVNSTVKKYYLTINHGLQRPCRNVGAAHAFTANFPTITGKRKTMLKRNESSAFPKTRIFYKKPEKFSKLKCEKLRARRRVEWGYKIHKNTSLHSVEDCLLLISIFNAGIITGYLLMNGGLRCHPHRF